MIRLLIALLILAGCTGLDQVHQRRVHPRNAPQHAGPAVDSAGARTIRDCATPFARVDMMDEQETWVVFVPVDEVHMLRRDRVVHVANERRGACFVRTEHPAQGDPGDWRPLR